MIEIKHEIKRLTREARRRTLRDLSLVAALTLTQFWAASALELAERIHQWASGFEFVQADELLTTLLVFALGLGWFSFRRFRELRRELTARVELEGNLARTLEQNRDLARRSLEVQERERKEIAHELHDELGQYLNAIEIEAASLRRMVEEGSATATAIDRLRRHVRHVYQVARTLMYRLRPAGLDEFGLEEALQDMVDGWQRQRAGVNYVLAIDSDLPALDETLTITLFRLVQESLTNVAKHSDAHHVAVRLRADAHGWIELRIEDDGRGLPADLRPGLGMIGMRERAGIAGGTMSTVLPPKAGGGTVLVFRLPLRSGSREAA